jgi:hypothetical protein
MTKLSWSDITVFQYQQLMEAWSQKDATVLDNLVRTVSIVTGMTEHEVDSLGIGALNNLAQEVAFTSEKIEPDPAPFIDLPGARYRCIYDIREMPCARYIESSVFGADPIGNLHKLAATMVMPQKRIWNIGPWVDDKYDAAKHSLYAQDMLSAPITTVLGSVLFFCEVYLISTWNLAVFSTHHRLEQTTTEGKIATEAIKALCNNMGGTIRSSWSLGTKVYPWETSMN